MKYLVTCIFIVTTFSLFSQQVNQNPWVVRANPADEITYTNPVIQGFYPDPSICRVGEDYYLVTSSFEFFPGVPIFHSKDLIHWKQIGYCIDRKDQISENLRIFAPTLRYHNGIFYMITTNTRSKLGTFYVTSNDPIGPWSKPINIEIGGIDPDLFFDDDGRAYVTNSYFELSEINLETVTLIGQKRKVWHCTGGRHPEAPHIYKKDGYYYLMAAEGGTEEAHSVTIARSNSIWGSYINNPANPIVAHANVAGVKRPIQGVGHADMVQAHDNSWWMVLHGYRTPYILGRETCLVPVSWPKGSWPIINGNGTVPSEMAVSTLPQVSFVPKQIRSEFDNEELGIEWNYIQHPNENHFVHDSEKGTLTLRGSALEIGEDGSPTFVGRRLTDMKFSATTRLKFDPKNDNEEAGIIMVNNKSYFGLLVSSNNGQRYLVVKLQFGQTIYRSEEIELLPGAIDLRVKGTGPEFAFSYSQNGEDFKTIDKADAHFLSTEVVGWFTGVYVGLYASGNGTASKAKAIYDCFEYVGH